MKTKYYHYAIVASGKSIDESPQFSFEKYEDMFNHIYDKIQPDNGEFIVSYYFRRSQVDNQPIREPRPVATITYISTTPNPWVTKVFSSSIIVWTSEVEE